MSYKLTFIEGPPDKIQASYHGSVGEQAFGYLREGVARCVESGAFRKVDIDATAQAFWAAVHGIVHAFGDRGSFLIG